MEFSHNDEFLLSVSRDRNWCIWQARGTFRTHNLRNPILEPFQLLYKGSKAHERIIWSCDWSLDDKYFATGSRDKLVSQIPISIQFFQVKVWAKNNEKDEWACTTTFPIFPSPITSLSWAPITQSYMLAIGQEDGLISLWSVSGQAVLFVNPSYLLFCSIVIL